MHWNQEARRRVLTRVAPLASTSAVARIGLSVALAAAVFGTVQPTRSDAAIFPAVAYMPFSGTVTFNQAQSPLHCNITELGSAGSFVGSTGGAETTVGAQTNAITASLSWPSCNEIGCACGPASFSRSYSSLLATGFFLYNGSFSIVFDDVERSVYTNGMSCTIGEDDFTHTGAELHGWTSPWYYPNTVDTCTAEGVTVPADITWTGTITPFVGDASGSVYKEVLAGTIEVFLNCKARMLARVPVVNTGIPTTPSCSL